MKKLIGFFVFTALLAVPVSVIAQDSRHDQQNSRHYEDKAHHDSHDWNDNEDQAYRRYLTEHHKKAHDFDKASKREQNNYWKWRHEHPDSDHR